MRVLALMFGACGPPGGSPTFADGISIPTADPAAVRFVALGDTGKGNDTQRAVAQVVADVCAERGCDFVLLLGDLLYPRGMRRPDDPRATARIAEPYAATGVPVYGVLGNHDYAHGRDRARAQWLIDWSAAAPNVHLPAHAWQATAGPAVVLGIDTAAAFQYGAGPQREWLAGHLVNADAPWTIVAGHHPLRSDGPHGNAGTYEGWSSVPWMSGAGLSRWFDSFCGSVDLYLAGHDHSRQLLEHCDVTLIVSGAGSSATPIVDRDNRPRFARGTPGIAWLELRAGRGQIVFVDANGIVEGRFDLSVP